MMGPQGGPPGQGGGMGMGLPNNMHPSQVPPAFIMDPMMMQMEIKEEQFPMFLMQRLELLEPNDKSHAGKQIAGLVRNVFFASIAGITLNVQIKKITALKFFEWPKYLRIGFRIPLFFLPFSLFFYNSFDKKYFNRFQKYQRTGDVKYLDPNGVHFKEFNQKMKRDVIRLD